MPRGTADVVPKPPTAKQLQKLVTAYESCMNDIIEATKRLDPDEIEGIEGRWIRESAFTLHSQLSALYAHVADEERESRQ